MTRTATVDRLLRSAHATRTEDLSGQLQSVRATQEEVRAMQEDVSLQAASLERTRAETLEDLARQLLPTARAMAALTEESRRTLEGLVERSQENSERAAAATERASQAARKAAADLVAATLKASAVVDRLGPFLVELKASTDRQNPWGPALLCSAIPTASIFWLAWMVGALRL